MVKLKHISLHKSGNVPDHILQEADALMERMIDSIFPCLKDISPNIVLSAFNRLHASIIVTIISGKDGELKRAALLEAKGLILNIEDIGKVKIFEDDKI